MRKAFAVLLLSTALGCGTSPASGPSSSSAPPSGGLASASPPPVTAPPPSGSTPKPVPAGHQPFFGALTSVALGGANLCATEPSGTVRCVGDWPVPFGTNGVRNQGFRTPVTVEKLPPPSSVGLSQHRGCAIAADQTVWCWGNTTATPHGWTGAPEGRLVATEVDGVRDAVALALGWTGSCALVKGGKVKCWGPTFSVGFEKDAVVPPIRTLPIERVVHITGQRTHACVVLEDGTVACWGDDPPAARRKRAPGEESIARVAGLSAIVDASAGDAHDCALTKGGEVFCWGQNGSGQLGDGTFEPRPSPVRVSGLSDVVQVAASHGFSCALTKSGKVSCWGDAGSCVLGGQLSGCSKRTMGATTGPVELTFCPTPQPIALPFAATSITLGSGTGCAQDEKGNVACWGRSLTENVGSCEGRAL